MRKGKRRRKQYVKQKRTVEKYGKPYRGSVTNLDCEASGIYRRESVSIPSKGVSMSGKAEACAVRQQGQTIHQYNKEMIERERAAQKEANRRKKMVAPMYNKGAYQYIGDAATEVIEGLGRKK